MRLPIQSLILIVALAGATPALASNNRDREDCWAFKDDPDRSIKGCTRIIDDNDVSKDRRIDAFSSRGEAHEVKGDYERAIADHSAAIALDPPYTFLWVNRGDAYEAAGDHDKAIADYSEAIRLNPEQASHYKNRGLAHRRKRNSAEAISDLQKYLDLGGGKQYGDQREVEKMIGEISDKKA
jgi:tetratricopeptide (TPR) repeat protein